MNINKLKIVCSVSKVAILALCVATAFSNVNAADTADRGQLSAKDYKFVTAAADAGKMEVSLGQLTMQKASDPSVRDFGQRMVTDHQKANDELRGLAAKKGAILAQVNDKKDQKAVEHLNSLSGMDFDKAYIKQMVTDHKAVVKEFQAEADKGDDADLKAWATKTLPALEDHLSMAQNLETTIAAVKPQAKATP